MGHPCHCMLLPPTPIPPLRPALLPLFFPAHGAGHALNGTANVKAGLGRTTKPWDDSKSYLCYCAARFCSLLVAHRAGAVLQSPCACMQHAYPCLDVSVDIDIGSSAAGCEKLMLSTHARAKCFRVTSQEDAPF
eukprot:scaffold1116_cov103-Isochrysis_galbana.AAC.15